LRDSEKRPQNALQAAKALGVADTYATSRKSRIDYYLKSGPPPFAAELKKKFDQFWKSTARKLFFINGYYNGTCPMNFLESEYRVEGMECFRISRENNNDDISKLFNDVVSTAKSIRGKKIILIDDLEKLDSRRLRILYEIVNNREDLRIAAAGGRWVNPDIKREIFDPLKLWSGKRATEEALRAFLKRDVPDIDLDSLQDKTGGDPDQIYNFVRHYYKLPGTAIDDNNTIPLLMFVKFERKKRDIVESLITRGFLIRHKDSVSFISRGFREYIYDEIAEPTRKDYHKFWALAAEEYIGDNEERLELTAYHWGMSGDAERGYKYNETAAGEFYKNGDLIRARKFAETLLNYNPRDNSQRKFALKISGDIYGDMGYFNSARRMYLRVLSHHGDRETPAEIKKELAGIYIASGEYRKSRYYLKQSLEYYKNSGDRKSLSECEAAVTEAFMGIKDYPRTLERMITAARDFNGFNLKTDLLPQYDSGGQTDDLRNLNSILKLAQHIKNNKMIIKAYTGLGQYYINFGENDESVAQFNKALETSEKAKRKKDIIDSLINLGSCHHIRGDLFMAIECFQNARQAAESSGNFYLKTSAELKLTDVSLAMGNFTLARDVLRFIENHDIYNEDKYLKLLVDLRRAGLYLALGNREKSLNLAGRISRSATIRKRNRLALQADLIICESQPEPYGDDNLDRLKVIHLRADKFGFPDLVSEVMLLMGEHHLNNGNHQNAWAYFEDIRISTGIPGHLKLKSAIYLARIAAEQNRHIEAIESMIETESCAAASGFIPVALQAAETLGEMYYSRGRADLSEDCRVRANSYLEKILSAIPEGYSAEKIGKQLKLIARTPPYSAKETVIPKKPAVFEID
jgi:tetratricopeptide (TPR) repeat protein